MNISPISTSNIHSLRSNGQPLNSATASAPSSPSTEKRNQTSNSEKTETDFHSNQEQRAVIAELARRDREVRAHEQAHATVGGIYAGAPSLTYERGPNGRLYATSGEVSIDTSPVPNNPQATLDKALLVQRAALAPAQPSNADRRIAAQAAAIALQARVELNTIENTGSAREIAPSESDELNRQFTDSGAVADQTSPGTILDLQV